MVGGIESVTQTGAIGVDSLKSLLIRLVLHPINLNHLFLLILLSEVSELLVSCCYLIHLIQLQRGATQFAMVQQALGNVLNTQM